MASAFPLRWRALRLCKQGNAAEEYEDACAGDAPSGRFAVADGASEASFAALWAKQLVERFVVDPGKPWRDLDWIGPVRKQWSAHVDKLELPWYAEEKRELGAFATFLGLVFRPSTVGKHGYWRSVSVGDCCLFHTRGGKLVHAFPMTRADDFGNRPQLLRSRGAGVADIPKQQAHGRWLSQDRFLLMTDALAQWFLHRLEASKDPLAEIAQLLTEESPDAAFVGWIDERRRKGVLKNDDVTLVVVDVV